MKKEKKPETTQTMDALLVSEIRYRRLFEAAKDGILILHGDTGKIIDVNPFLIKLLGYSHEEFINKFIWEIVPLKDKIANKKKFIELKNSKYVRYEDLPLETADGKKSYVEFVSNVYNENNHTVIQCNIRDITARKQQADILAAERERLKVTLQSIGDGVIATDADGNIEMMNNIAEQLCGWNLDEAKGKPLASVFNIINENTRLPHANPVEKVLATGNIIELENHTVIISKDGTEHIIADSAAPIRNNHNQIIGVVLVFRDITEKQKLIENTQRNQKLESLGLLAGGIAHDFNNLMGGIFGFIDLAINESRNPNVTNYLSKAMCTIDRARSLTRQLLTFSQGGNPLIITSPISAIIKDTSNFSLNGTNVACHYTLPSNLWQCFVDKDQIAQAIANLVINAQQSMPNGGTIEISAQNIIIAPDEYEELGAGNYVKVTIKDFGIGISRKLLPRIFDPFFTTKNKGHGLGLTTCYSIISRHKGKIEIESEIDKGTIVYLFLPASTEEKPIPAGKKTAEDFEGSGLVIIMDDEIVIQETISGMLESHGYSVVCKSEGRETLEFFNQESKAKRDITCLILDLTIPDGMGGLEVVQEIRKTNMEIPVFVASGYADDPIMKNPSEYGFTGSICKPFRRFELFEMLAKHLNK